MIPTFPLDPVLRVAQSNDKVESYETEVLVNQKGEALSGLLARLRAHRRYIVRAGLHAKMEFEFLEPIRPGVRARSRGKVVDKYERRGKPYMVTEYVTEAEDGTVLVRGRFTQMLFRD